MNADATTEAQRAAVAAALLGLVGTGLAVLGFWKISGTSLRVVQGVGLLTSGAALCVLRVGRPVSVRLANALFLLVLVPTVVMVWMADDARAMHSARWVPYEPNKLSVLALAMIAPPGWWVGTVAILMFVGSALAHHFAFAEALRAHLPEGEPFGVIAYAVFALVLLGFRQRSRAVREALDNARAEKLTLARLARVALSLRDLANTPLQTLELVRRALLTDRPALTKQAHRMAHALERLRRLNDILRPYEDTVALDEAAQLEGRRKRGPRGVVWKENAAPSPGSRAARRSG